MRRGRPLEATIQTLIVAMFNFRSLAPFTGGASIRSGPSMRRLPATQNQRMMPSRGRALHLCTRAAMFDNLSRSMEKAWKLVSKDGKLSPENIKEPLKEIRRALLEVSRSLAIARNDACRRPSGRPLSTLRHCQRSNGPPAHTGRCEFAGRSTLHEEGGGEGPGAAGEGRRFVRPSLAVDLSEVTRSDWH